MFSSSSRYLPWKTTAFAVFFLFSSQIDPAIGCPLNGWSDSDRLTEAVNDARQENGLPRLTVSPTLVHVAQTHIRNLDLGGLPSSPCNLHSWNPPQSGESHSECCYTADHVEAECMWAKPEELTEDWSGDCQQVTFDGFEISYGGSWEGAVNSWLSSQGHRAVMLTQGTWSGLNMIGMLSTGCSCSSKPEVCLNSPMPIVSRRMRCGLWNGALLVYICFIRPE